MLRAIALAVLATIIYPWSPQEGVERKGGEVLPKGEGVHLTIKEALAECYMAGFRNRNLVIAVAVMTAESGRNSHAYNINKTGPVAGSIDRGLFQINDYWHPGLTDREAYRVKPNIAYAYRISRGENWTLWSTFKNGAHRKFMPQVRLVKARGGWRKLVK